MDDRRYRRIVEGSPESAILRLQREKELGRRLKELETKIAR